MEVKSEENPEPVSCEMCGGQCVEYIFGGFERPCPRCKGSGVEEDEE